MIDDEDWNGFFGWFEFKTELLPDGGEEGWGGIVGGRFVVGRPPELEIVAVG